MNYLVCVNYLGSYDSNGNKLYICNSAVFYSCDLICRINQHCFDTALNFYKMALNRNLTKGRRSGLVCAACLYIACRLEKTPRILF